MSNREGYTQGNKDAQNGKQPYVPYNTPWAVKQNYEQGYNDGKKK